MQLRGIIAILPVLVLLWTGIGGYLVQRRLADLEAAGRSSRNLTLAFQENILRTVEAIDTTIRALRVARAHDPDHFDLAAWARDSGLTRELTLQLSMSGRTGALIGTTLAPVDASPVNIADREHFRVTRDLPGDTLFISRPVLGRVSGRWSVQFVRKMFDKTGAFDGVIVASLDPAFLARFYTSLDVGRGALLLLGRDGIVRAAAPDSLLGADLSATPLMAGAREAANGLVRMRVPAGDRKGGIERTYGWRYVDPFGLVVAVGLSTVDALADYDRAWTACVGIGVLLTLLTLAAGAGFARIQRKEMRTQALLQAAVDNISQGLMVVDAARRVSVLNARAAELLGLPADLAAPGYAFNALLAWQLRAGEFEGPESEAVRLLVHEGGIALGDSVYRRTRQNGTVLDIRTKTLPSGMAVRTFTDITEQEQAARGLADARDAAEAAMRIRSEFLAVMSHEIRTPLNGIIGVAGLLDDADLRPDQLEYVRLIRQSGDHLLELINDILDFSRLEAAGVQLEDTAFDAAALVHDAVGMFRTQASTKGLHLSAIATEAVPGLVCGDPGRLRQVLLNLIGNAVKFTDCGWVSLTLTHDVADDGRIRLLFSVADSGIGIAADSVERMFEEFTQMDGSISRRFGGSGLGLAICRRLVELMGGRIAVESTPGMGSTFRFDVTLRLADPACVAVPAAEAAGETGPGLRILVAEDNATNRLVALRLLERLGHRADAVSTGVEAIAAVGLGQYDLILMDVMMPDMDGVTATRQIRAAEQSGERIPIIGLTARSSDENRAACLEAGMDAVAPKPVTLPLLRKAIADGRKAGGEMPEPTTPRLRDLADMLGNEAVAEIIGAFTEDTQAHLAAMLAAAEVDDRQTIYRCAHTVAGAARNVGAEGLAALASELEQRVGLLTVPKLLGDLEAIGRELDAVLAGLEDLGDRSAA